ncbi:MAG: hypothetical protein J6R52_00940 [Alphaproteobacteria bacterium]|nr:hypothetical protein [Alphaproteobacteria bacterium]
MPKKKKIKTSKIPKILIWTLIVILIILMIVSFSTPVHMTEIVLYP